MQIVRTIVWVLLLVALIVFSMANWEPGVTVRIWNNLVVETKLPAVVVIAFLIGLVPMWLVHRASKWQLQRRIGALENAARAAAAPSPAEPEPVAPPADSPPPLDEHRPLAP